MGEVEMRCALHSRILPEFADCRASVLRAARVLLAVKSGGGLALLPSPLADLDRDLVRVIGPIPEVDYPIYLLTHRDLRKIPRIASFFDYCLSQLRPVLIGTASRKTI